MTLRTGPILQFLGEDGEAQEDVTKVEVIHAAGGYHLEVEGEVRGTVFPDLSSVLLWLNMLSGSGFFEGMVSVEMVDRRENRGN